MTEPIAIPREIIEQSGFPEKIRSLAPHLCRFSAHKLPAENCMIYFASYPAGTEIEPHTHETENWGVITRGRMILTIEGREQAFGPGQWYHIPRGAEHSARCDEFTEEIEFWFSQKKS